MGRIMKSHDEANLENMALAAELARQLCHDFNNLLYNLFLQIEISTNAPHAVQENWTAIKRDANKIARLLQEWDRFHDRFTFSEESFDLNEMVRQLSGDLSAPGRVGKIAPPISSEPLMVVNSATDCRHLLRLAIEDLIQEWKDSTETLPLVSIQTEVVDARVIVRMSASQQPGQDGEVFQDGGLPWRDDAAPTSLMAAACRSLAVRLGVTIERYRSPDGRLVVAVDFSLDDVLIDKEEPRAK